MNIRRITARTAAAGVTTALAAGALVGFSTTAADAVTVDSTYACTAAGSPVGDFGMVINTPVVPAEGTAGQSFPAGLLGLDSVVTIPAGAAALLGSFGVDGGHIDNYAANVGSTKIKAPLTFEAPVAQDNGSATMSGVGANLPFTLPAAGTYAIALPKSFTFIPTSGGTDLPVTVDCTTADPASLGSIKLSKQFSTITAKVAKAGKSYKVTAAVNSERAATGAVTTKIGKKTYSGKLNKGKAVIKLPKSAKNKKVTLTYKGDKFVAGATLKNVKIK